MANTTTTTITVERQQQQEQSPTPLAPGSTSNNNTTNSIPVLPNELLLQVINFTHTTDRVVYLFVSRFTYSLVSPSVYRKAVFPDNTSMTDIIQFCHKYGQSLETIKLPQGRYYSDIFFSLLFNKLCPRLTFLQSSMTPKQVQRYRKPTMTFMLTHIPTSLSADLYSNFIHHSNNNTHQHQQHPHHHHHHPHQNNDDHHQHPLNNNEINVNDEEEEEEEGFNEHDDDDFDVSDEILPLDCCSSCLIFPTTKNLDENDEDNDDDPNRQVDRSTMMHISHYFHHPGALRNGILPTYGEELLSLTLNRYDVLTASVAKVIIAKCPRLRYLVAPVVKAEGLWMMLRWCDTLTTVIVGLQADEDHDDHVFFNDTENEKAVATIAHYKRVWCVHAHVDFADHHQAWHIGIIPRK